MKVVPDTLRSLTLKDFTLFHKAELKFGRDLNVIIGENGTGKSHILKAAYSGIAAALWTVSGSPLTKTQLQTELAAKLIGVFRPDALGRLVRRARGRLKCELIYAFERPKLNIRYSFSRLAKTEVVALRAPTAGIPQRPIFLPTRELLTLLPEFVPLYDSKRRCREASNRTNQAAFISARSLLASSKCTSLPKDCASSR
jgi:predicted ATP-dependent endonuclease of OLD family